MKAYSWFIIFLENVQYWDLPYALEMWFFSSDKLSYFVERVMGSEVMYHDSKKIELLNMQMLII